MSYGKIRRILGFILLLAVTVSASYVSAESQPPVPSGGKEIQKPNKQSNKDKKTPYQIKKAAVSSSVSNSANVAQPKLAPNEPKKKCCEESSEDWWTNPDWWVVVFTGAICIIGWIQLRLFRGQLHIMSESLIDAEDAAKTAKEAAEATKENVSVLKNSSERQLRAYIFAHGTGGFIKLENNQIYVNFNIVIRNSGMTPAYRVRQHVKAVFKKIPLTESLEPTIPTEVESSSDIAQNSSVSCAPLGETLSLEDTVSFENGEKAFFIYGIVRYEDAFGQERFSYFRYLYNFEVATTGGGGLRHCNEGNKAT